MKQKSSNENMKSVTQAMDMLGNIKEVEMPIDLYHSIIFRLNNKPKLVPFYWAKIAVAAFVMVIAGEFYLLNSKQTEQTRKEFTALVPQNQNHLYHE